MASITIRGLDDGLKARLRLRAALHGRSMEDEARDSLRCALSREPARLGREPALLGALGSAIRGRFAALGGVALPEVAREGMRVLPGLDE